MTEPEIYYERVVLTYLCGDIRHLLAQEEPHCGILLGPVINGVDTVGGIISGFEVGSQRRSIDVLVRHMNLTDPEATFTYQSLRCGLVHQGTAKYGVWFFNLHGELNRHSVIYSGDKDWIYFDCVALAIRFLAAAENIWENCRNEIKHMPRSEDSGHAAVLGLNLPHIQELVNDYAEELHCVEKRHEGELIRRETSSMSAYTPEGVLNPEFRLPPRT
jgi:hypothetical protein